jgi:hypothetical protein
MRHSFGIGLSLTGQRNPSASAPPPALAFDGAGTGSGTSVSSVTFSHIVGVTSGYGMIEVAVSYLDPNASSNNVSGITYAGQAMTQLAGSQKVNGSIITERWYLLNPPAGTANVVVTCTGALNIVAGSSSWDGVKQAAPFGTPVLGSSTGTSASVSIAIGAGNALVCSLGVNCTSNNTNSVPQGNLTSIGNAQVGGSTAFRTRGTLCYDNTTPAGTQTPTFTISLSKAWAISAVEVKAA